MHSIIEILKIAVPIWFLFGFIAFFKWVVESIVLKVKLRAPDWIGLFLFMVTFGIVSCAIASKSIREFND